MKKENYVNQILRKVKCSRTKKEEIKKQLLSDISTRMDNGETIEQIAESMGAAKEIAEEFNQNLSEEEKKAYKRIRIIKILLSIVVVLFLLGTYVWWWIPKSYEIGHRSHFTKETIEEKVEETILLLNANDIDGLKAYAIEEMKTALTQEALNAGRAPFGNDWGEMKDIGTVYMLEIEQKGQMLIFTQVHVTYENVDVIYTINFDEEMRLAGIFWQ